MDLFQSLVQRKYSQMLEQVVSAKGNLGIPRSQMPQIPSEKVPEFLDYLKGMGVVVRKESVECGRLKGTQKEIDMDKVQSMIAKGNLSKGKPLIASSDDYILDGHHRWAGMRSTDPKLHVDIYRVWIPIHALLKYARNFQGVEFKAIGEQLVLTS